MLFIVKRKIGIMEFVQFVDMNLDVLVKIPEVVMDGHVIIVIIQHLLVIINLYMENE